MKKSKIMLGTGLGALAVTGIAVASQSDGNVVDTVVKDTVVDFAISGKEPIKAKAAWTNPTEKFVYPGFEYYVVSGSEAGQNLSYFANKLGVSVDTLRYLNDIKDGERVTSPWGTPYAGSLLFYKSPYPNNREHYYNLSQQAPTRITSYNWDNQRALNTESSTPRYPSANYFTYSLFENEIELNSLNQLVLKGWAAQTNYTDTTGYNNQTAIIVTESGTKNAVSVNVASNTNINPTNQFVYNKSGGANVAKRCPQSDAYLDREISFTNVGAGSSTSLGGCWHNFANSGFDARIDVANLFSGDKHNKVYDLYIAQSTGANPNRLLYKPLSSRSIVKRKYQNDRLSGTVTFKGKDSKIVDGASTINIFDDQLVMSTGLSGTGANWVNGSNLFKPGRYKIISHAMQPESKTIYYQLEGYGATAGYHGWTSSAFMADSELLAQLSFTIDNEKFKLHFVSGDKEDKGTVIQTPKEFTLYSNSSLGPTSVNINKSNYEKIRKGNIVWALQKEKVNPDNRNYTVRFNASNPPKDITYTYTKNYEVQVNYINANTGELINSEKREIPYGKTRNFKYSDLGTVDATDNSLINFRGKKYKFAGD